MIAILTAGLSSAILSVLGSLMTKKLFESIIRKLLVVVLTKIIKSTENTVDDNLIAPILKELEK